MLKILSLLSFIVVMSACESMRLDYQARVCHYDGAYEQGANAARQGQLMAGENIAQQCPEQKQVEVRKGYREGYTSVKNEPQPLVVINNGEATRECHDHFGQSVCGYGCKEAYGDIRCAQQSNHQCMEAYGKITCGLNCRMEYGNVKCDEYE